MSDRDTQSVPRPPSDPLPEDVLDAMDPGRPYSVSDLVDQFDVSRWTILRRLNDLHDAGEVEREKHSPNMVTWWVPVSGDGEENDD